jgi:hypothetical protein
MNGSSHCHCGDSLLKSWGFAQHSTKKSSQSLALAGSMVKELGKGPWGGRESGDVEKETTLA